MEAETQFSPIEVFEQETQAVVTTQEFTGQTRLALESSRTQESQAVVATQEFTSQTTADDAGKPDGETPAVVGNSDGEIPGQSDAVASASQESLMTPLGLDLDTSFDNSRLDLSMAYSEAMTPMKGAGAAGRRPGAGASMRDGTAQTDPVTIIIGDASFLVKKLKSSAINPSKVGSTLNR